jgi:hypothetical protein
MLCTGLSHRKHHHAIEQERNRREALDRLIAGVANRSHGRVLGTREHQKRIAVGRRVLHQRGRNPAARARAVLNDDALEPLSLDRASPYSRAVTSVIPPAASPTTSVIGWLGNSCAEAEAISGEQARAPRANRRVKFRIVWFLSDEEILICQTSTRQGYGLESSLFRCVGKFG